MRVARLHLQHFAISLRGFARVARFEQRVGLDPLQFHHLVRNILLLLLLEFLLNGAGALVLMQSAKHAS